MASRKLIMLARLMVLGLLGVDSVPYGFGAEALGGGPDGSEGELLIVLEDGP
jgi:hypothetical protein